MIAIQYFNGQRLAKSDADPLDLVAEFNRKFDLPRPNVPTTLSQEDINFRVNFMLEELLELKEALQAGDHAQALDALVDLAYVLYGTVLWTGLAGVFREAFTVVHAANLAKEQVKAADESKRGHKLDLIKPEGWIPPDRLLEALLIDWESRIRSNS